MTPTTTARRILVALLLGGMTIGSLSAQVSFDRLREAARESHNWLTYSGGYFSQRHSELDQITPANVGDLELQWVYQTPVFGPWQATPVVVDGVMYVSQRPNDIVALDARTGRVFWIYRYPTPSDHRACCGANNRGVTVLGDRVFMGTLDAHVVAIDASTRRRAVGRRGGRQAPVVRVHPGAARRQGQGHRRHDRRGTAASAGSSPPSTPRRARRRGGSIPFPDLARRATKRGSRVRPIRRPSATRRPGNTAGERPG